MATRAARGTSLRAVRTARGHSRARQRCGVRKEVPLSVGRGVNENWRWWSGLGRRAGGLDIHIAEVSGFLEGSVDWLPFVTPKAAQRSFPLGERSGCDQTSDMAEATLPWPHAPTHQLCERGTYLVTAATYQKAHYFRGAERLRVLQRGLLKLAADYGWQIEAWVVFPNHYHFVAHSPAALPSAENLPKMLTKLHTKTATWLNRWTAHPDAKFGTTTGRRASPPKRPILPD